MVLFYCQYRNEVAVLEYAKQVGLRIVKARENVGLNQLELAKKTKISPSVMNRIEQGIRQVRDNEILDIANVTDVSTDYLLGNKQTPEWASEQDLLELDKMLETNNPMTFGGVELDKEDKERINQVLVQVFWERLKKMKDSE